MEYHRVLHIFHRLPCTHVVYPLYSPGFSLVLVHQTRLPDTSLFLWQIHKLSSGASNLVFAHKRNSWVAGKLHQILVLSILHAHPTPNMESNRIYNPMNAYMRLFHSKLSGYWWLLPLSNRTHPEIYFRIEPS